MGGMKLPLKHNRNANRQVNSIHPGGVDTNLARHIHNAVSTVSWTRVRYGELDQGEAW